MATSPTARGGRSSSGSSGAQHGDPLPTGPIGSAGSTEWSLEEEEGLRPQFPELEGHYESTDGVGGQFQGETNYGQIGRGDSGPNKVRQHGIIDVANHGKNVSDAYGGRRALPRRSRPSGPR